ncbi:hypothetical protein [Spiroplasma clarkii]|nr:hypothetical protein [Spiroplasma clarkii]
MKNIKDYIIEKTQIFISEKKAMFIIGLIAINMVVLSMCFIWNLVSDQNTLANLSNQAEEYINLKNKMTMIIVSFIFNAVLNIVYVLYVYLSISRKKVGYVFVIFWFFVWALFSIGTFIMYDTNIWLKSINLLVGISCTFMLLVLFFDLQKRKREIDFTSRKERSKF